MKIAKALKEKNILVREILELTHRINKYNAIIKGNTRPYNMDVEMKSLLDKKEQLVRLKAAITKANQPIQDKIYRLSEYKDFLKMLKDLNTLEGKNVHDYREVISEYESQIKETDKNNVIALYQKKVDELQEELDNFNHSTELEG